LFTVLIALCTCCGGAGENGIMKKKSVLMQRDIEDQKEEMKNLLIKEKELHDQIKMLEKEVRTVAIVW
jgi:cell division protein FtsB